MLIVIEGVDGSGKQTQADLLCKRLLASSNVKKLAFPNYESTTSALVKMYLGGEFGSKPEDVNPYVASSFYAVDRIGTYLKEIKGKHDNDIIIADRYTTSNAVHQAGKLEPCERDAFLDWLFDYEYNLLGLPKPDIVVFLNMPPMFGKQLMMGRNNKITGEENLDIHEENYEYLQNSYNTALYVAKKYNWSIIDCVKNNEIRSIEDINNEIYNMVMSRI